MPRETPRLEENQRSRDPAIMIRGFLIDFDGTLVDSVPTLFRAYTRFLQLNGEQAKQSDFITMNGFTSQEMVACVKSWYHLNKSVEELLKMYKAIVSIEYQKTRLFYGVRNFLKWTKANEKKVAIVTAALQEWVIPVLQKENIAEYFTCLVTPDSVEKGKPHPDGFMTALKILDIPSEEAIAIEDSEHGLQAALGAHVSVIQFIGGSKVLKPEPKALMNGNWEEILEYVKKQDGRSV